jgi:hypothetical protein
LHNFFGVFKVLGELKQIENKMENLFDSYYSTPQIITWFKQDLTLDGAIANPDWDGGCDRKIHHRPSANQPN